MNQFFGKRGQQTPVGQPVAEVTPKSIEKNNVLYQGSVLHKRFRPRRHSLKYHVFSLLLDIDQLDQIDRKIRCFSRNKWNLYSFHDVDFGNRDGEPLRPYVLEKLAEANIAVSVGTIKLLCYPRMLGYAFNPLSIYFCYSADQPDSESADVVAILYEVHNTFGETHTYVIDPTKTGNNLSNTDRTADETTHALSRGKIARHSCDKKMHVSPFAPMDMNYRFRISYPDDNLSLAIQLSNAQGMMLTACFNGIRHDLSQRALLRNLFSYPLMTVKIIGGIHWEALLLWLKGVPLFRHVKQTS